MTIWICATCAIEHADTERPPEICAICTDERQWVPATGQAWTTRERLAAEGHRLVVEELEPGLDGIWSKPSFGIGQRGLLVRTGAGNLLFDPPGFLDEAGVEELRELGGVAVIASSHPHLTGVSIQWSHAFDRAPVLVAADDAEWIRRPDPVIESWRDQRELLPGTRLVQCGGHFPGSAVVQWDAGADEAGVLLTGDTVGINPDGTSIAAMWSFPNRIPLSRAAIQQLLDRLAPLRFDRLYDAWQTLPADAHRIVVSSLQRYLDVEPSRLGA